MMSKLFFTGNETEFEYFISSKNYNKIILLVDANTNGFCLPILKKLLHLFSNTHSIIIPQGESNKRLDVVEMIWQQLFQLIANRNTLLVCVGGGMVCDMGAFAASTFKRGIDVIHIPTTLLAMVDACYGGKTGLDFNGIKNSIGTFYQANAIYMNPIFLNTLNERMTASGFAEMIKHALISSVTHWEEIQQFTYTDFINIDAICVSLLIKKKIVDADVNDTSIRQQLNFGHSLGHAIESASLNTSNPLLHGEAIMLGMELELAISQQILQLSKNTSIEFAFLKQKLFPHLKHSYTWHDIKGYLQHDKKNQDSYQMSLLQEIGKCEVGVSVSEAIIKAVLASYDYSI
jgi:3-dehydroquinate synthase